MSRLQWGNREKLILSEEGSLPIFWSISSLFLMFRLVVLKRQRLNHKEGEGKTEGLDAARLGLKRTLRKERLNGTTVPRRERTN